MELFPTPTTNIEALLKSAEVIDRVEETTQANLRNETEYILRRKVEVESVEPQKLQALLRSDLPTLAIDVNRTFGGASMLGIANARRENPAVNIIYISPASAGVEIIEDQSGQAYITVKRGHIMDRSGNILSGMLEQPLQVDAIETVDTALLTELKKMKLPTLSEPEMLQHLNNKGALPLIAEESGVTVPSRLQPSDLSSGSDVVIKPSRSSQGRGVYFSSAHPNGPDQWLKYHDFLETNGYDPLIEKRIQSWPIHDPKTGERLDWNVRAIISNGQLIDMYVRAGAHDTAINKSTGARTIPMYKFKRYLKTDDSASARVITEALTHAAQDFAETYPAFMNGLDLTVSEDGEVVLFEGNAGNVGGLQTIARQIPDNITKKIRNASTLLDIIESKIAKAPEIKSGGATRQLELSFESLIDFLEAAGEGSQVSQLLEAAADTSDANRLPMLRAALLARYKYQWLLNSDEWNASIDQLTGFPLELGMFAPTLDHHTLGSTALRNTVDNWLEVDPKSRDWKMLKWHAMASTGDLQQLRTAFHEATESGYEEQASEIAASGLSYMLDNCLFLLPESTNEGPSLQVSLRAITYSMLESDNPAADVKSIIESMLRDPRYVHSQEFLKGVGLTLYKKLQAYDYAAELADSMSVDTDAFGDFLLELVSESAVESFATEEGALFTVKQLNRFGSSIPQLVNVIEEKQQAVFSEPVISAILEPYKEIYPDVDIAYFERVLRALTTDTAAVEQLPEPDATSDLQSLGYIMLSHCIHVYSPTVDTILRDMMTKGSPLGGDISYLIDSWYTESD